MKQENKARFIHSEYIDNLLDLVNGFEVDDDTLYNMCENVTNPLNEQYPERYNCISEEQYLAMKKEAIARGIYDEFEDEATPVKETETAPTPTSKEGLEDRGFTPGEWEASYNSEEFPGQAAIYGCDGDTNGRVIAVLDTSDQTDMANIDLICAAPIMYDLLKWVVNEIETTPDELSDALLGMIKIKCNQLFTRINKD